MKLAARRDGRVAEGARLESVYTFTGIGGSNPSLSASNFLLLIHRVTTTPFRWSFRKSDRKLLIFCCSVPVRKFS